MSEGTTKGTLGKPALTYIQECNMERRLGRSLTDESNARPLSWGKLLERRVFDVMGTAYKLCSLETIPHPTIKCWAGSPDALKFDEGGTVCDIKAPLTLKSFCQLADCKSMQEVRKAHKDGDKFYYQLVSNAIITSCQFAELIVYMPYRSELDEIRYMASHTNLSNPARFSWIAWGTDDDLPWLPDGGHYKNLNVIRFEVPEADKIALTERVIMASEKLEEFKEVKALETA